MSNSRSIKNYAVTLILVLLTGFLGGHRFYVGKVGTGVLFLLTGGFFFIGWIIDIFTVLFGNFTDKTGSFVRPVATTRETHPPMADSSDTSNTSDTNKSESSPEKKKVPTWVWIVAGVLVFGLILQSCGGDTPPAEEDSEATSETEAVVEEEPEPVEPEEPVVPTSFATLDELRAAIENGLGPETNMGLPRELVVVLDEEDGWLNVRFVMNENLTSNLTLSSAWRQIGDIFDLARKADFVNELTIQASFPLINNLGEELGPQPVVTVYFDQEVYPRITTENLPGDRLGDAATSVAIHPAFQ